MTSKNIGTLILDAIFMKSKHIQRFCETFHKFCSNFHRFSPDFKWFFPDFHQIKSFGGAVAPPALPPSTPVAPPLAHQRQIPLEPAW